MNKFRMKNLQMLVATDVAARGLDVKDISHIINYNLPDDNEVYIHRSGRTGRAGKKGISIVIVNLKEKYKIKKIESMLKKKFFIKSVPTGKQICEKQLLGLVDKMEKIEKARRGLETGNRFGAPVSRERGAPGMRRGHEADGLAACLPVQVVGG